MLLKLQRSQIPSNLKKKKKRIVVHYNFPVYYNCCPLSFTFFTFINNKLLNGFNKYVGESTSYCMQGANRFCKTQLNLTLSRDNSTTEPNKSLGLC